MKNTKSGKKAFEQLLRFTSEDNQTQNKRIRNRPLKVVVSYEKAKTKQEMNKFVSEFQRCIQFFYDNEKEGILKKDNAYEKETFGWVLFRTGQKLGRNTWKTP